MHAGSRMPNLPVVTPDLVQVTSPGLSRGCTAGAASTTLVVAMLPGASVGRGNLMLRAFWTSILVMAVSAAAGRGQQKAPVLVFDVSGRLINAVVERNVDQLDAVVEVIQETPVRGI